MPNSITPMPDGSLKVVVDPSYVLTQPASLPDKKGQPKLTGFSITNLLVCMAQQVVAAKAPQLYTDTIRPMTGVEVKFEKGQFTISFKKVDPVLEEPVPVDQHVRTPAEMKESVAGDYDRYAREKGLGPYAKPE